MNNCPPDKVFWLEDGRTLKNLIELSNALKSITPSVYKHHVTEHKNDFANWIEHVFDEKTLAKKIRDASTRKEMARILDEKILGKKEKKATSAIVHKKSPASSTQKTPRKPRKKIKKRERVLDEQYEIVPEAAHPHIALATNIAFGIVLGSAITILVLMLL